MRKLFFILATVLGFLSIYYTGSAYSNNGSNYAKVSVMDSTVTKCEIEERGQTVINKLVLQSENMKSAAEKLHETREKQNQHDVSEHAKEIETAILELMNQSTILPAKNFSTLSAMTKNILQTATEYTWHNKFRRARENTAAFTSLESSITQLKETIKNMSDVPENICMTKKEATKNQMQIQLAIMEIYSEQIGRTSDNNCLTCVSVYCGKMEILAKTFREKTTNLDSKDFTTLNRTLGSIEHDAHEMKEQAEQGYNDEIHHSLETLNKAISRLTDEVGEVR